MSAKKKKERGPGRPWEGVPRVDTPIARSVRFPPKDFKRLQRAARISGISVEGLIKEAVKDKVSNLLK